MSDLNLVVLCGRLATSVEVRTFDSGAVMVRLLVTVRVDTPRKRVDVVPVIYWPSGDESLPFEDLAPGVRVWITGAVQRRFWGVSRGGRRSRLEVVAEQVMVKDPLGVTV